MAMDQHLIDTINKLQDALAPIGTSTIDLPQITVVGSQSSGKSSVLENIVGRDFLPRGTGIVTRRPLILQLINRRPTAANGSIAKPSAEAGTVDRVNDTNPDEWGEFLHKPGQKFYDFNEIRNEIVKETELKTGNNAGISSSPINLKIYSPHVLTLTLVDLPGLTKVPVGDQPKDIEIQIKEMLLKFISKPNAIILSVTAANTDLANSDGLKLAREVDPEGNRTIGVLTKIDLMDQGTDVLDILAGRVIPLKYGYIPVINRGQKDITTNKSIGAALKFEKEFFESHSAYRSRAQYCGTPYLAKSLNMILLNHIRNTMPEIKARIENSLKKFKAELAQIGPPMLNSSPSTIVLSAITEFCNEYRAILEGQGNDISSSELSGGARISFVLHEIFVNGINALDPFDQIRDVDIRTILYNSAGLSPNLFVGTAAFEVLVQKQIHRFEGPCLKCITLIYDELVRILSHILAKPQFNRYPALKDSVYDVFIGFLRKALVPTNKIVTDIVSMEETYINTGHPDLIKGNHAMAMVTEKLQLSKPVQLDPKTGKPIANHQQQNSVTESKSSGGGFFSNFFASKNKSRLAAMEAPPATLRASGQMTERETIETEVIKILIQSYFSIVKRTIIDLVPKAIMLKLVLLSKQDIQTELLEKLYQSESLNELLKENEKTVKRREELEKMVAVLGKALDIVSNV